MSEPSSSRRPAAEAHVDATLARVLISDQFAPLPERSLVALGEGWDYLAYLVDDTWVFRFPRRAVVVPGMEREIAVLPLLAPLLPAAVPAPVHVGRPSGGFPWPFYGARYIPGDEPLGLDDAARTRLARPLGRFLRALHACELDLPVDLQRRSDMTFRVLRARRALADLAGVWQPPPAIEDVLREAEALPPAEATAVVHGDLHFRQLLVHDGELSGVIDWVDVCRADPGQDFVPYWTLLSPAARSELLEEYGPISHESLLRGRVLAVGLNAVLARYGRDEGIAPLEAEALSGLRRAAAD
jgi:aminoglycoside phosphotransferase (APT) family kinase protein